MAEPVKKPVYAGPQIIDSAQAMFVHHNDNLALVVDHEFSDIPSWVEWDGNQKKMTIAQMGGTLTELEMAIEESELEQYKDRKRFYLIAKKGDEQIIHHLSFIYRQ